MPQDTDPLGFSETTRQMLEQTHRAMGTYFDFLKKSVSSFPSGGNEIGEKWKEQSRANISAFQELVGRLSTATSFEEALRIQTAFMHSQMNVLSKQVTGLGQASNKIVEASDTKTAKDTSD
jgi:hypothetical protein